MVSTTQGASPSYEHLLVLKKNLNADLVQEIDSLRNQLKSSGCLITSLL